MHKKAFKTTCCETWLRPPSIFFMDKIATQSEPVAEPVALLAGPHGSGFCP